MAGLFRQIVWLTAILILNPRPRRSRPVGANVSVWGMEKAHRRRAFSMPHFKMRIAVWLIQAATAVTLITQVVPE